MKLYKYILATAAIMTAGGVLTGCNDDDVTYNVVVPDEFSVVYNSINVPWDEVESVIDFEAPENWTASSAANWITVESVKGTSGVQRLYVTLSQNTMRLPRTGNVNINCGDESGVIKITQGGCSDESKIGVATASLEIPSFDYQTETIPFSQFATLIEGNLGLSMEEFGKGIDDDGDLEFFFIAKDGSWYKGGTSGTRMGGWLDNDYNVVPWDGAGYPAIASFIEIYGGENPTLVIGRAPGLPEGTKYTYNFGIATPDLKNYQLFSITATFPAADLNGEIIDTIDLYFQKDIANSYDPEPCVFDGAAIAAQLGATSISLCKVVSYDSAGEFLNYTANNGYWYNANGVVCEYPGTWYIEYYGNDEEAGDEELNSWQIGNMPGCDPASGVSKIGFWYNGYVVMFNIHVTIGEGGDTPVVPDDPTPGPSVDIVVEKDINFTAVSNGDYALGSVEFDMEDVLAALDCPSVDDLIRVSYDENGKALGFTANEGYWYLADGSVGGYGDAVVFIEYYYEDNTLAIGHMPNGEAVDTTCSFGFEYNGKAYMFNVHIVVTE